ARPARLSAPPLSLQGGASPFLFQAFINSIKLISRYDNLNCSRSGNKGLLKQTTQVSRKRKLSRLL
ncbi:hypothetical protein, partial [Anaerolinea sp.]|uniref:hypothetical protein n=1 Tax=Anaerolinea sp. TaxID=1872519 RepID=UPI002ACEF4D2